MLNHCNVHSTSSGNISGSGHRQRVVSSDDIHRISYASVGMANSVTSTNVKQKSSSKIRRGISFLKDTSSSTTKKSNNVSNGGSHSARTTSLSSKKSSSTYNYSNYPNNLDNDNNYNYSTRENNGGGSGGANSDDCFSADSGVASDLCNNFYKISVSQEQFTSTLDELNKNNNNAAVSRTATTAASSTSGYCNNNKEGGFVTSSRQYSQYANGSSSTSSPPPPPQPHQHAIGGEYINSPSSTTQRPKGALVNCHKSNHCRSIDGSSSSSFNPTMATTNAVVVASTIAEAQQNANHERQRLKTLPNHNRKTTDDIKFTCPNDAVVGNHNLSSTSSSADVILYSLTSKGESNPSSSSSRCNNNDGIGGGKSETFRTLTNGTTSPSSVEQSPATRFNNVTTIDISENLHKPAKKSSSSSHQQPFRTTSAKDVIVSDQNRLHRQSSSKKKADSDGMEHISRSKELKSEQQQQLTNGQHQKTTKSSSTTMAEKIVSKSPWRLPSKIKRRHSASKQSQQRQQVNSTSLMSTSTIVDSKSHYGHFSFASANNKNNSKNLANAAASGAVDDSILLSRSVVSSSGSYGDNQLKRAARPKSEHFASCQLISAKNGGGRGISSDSPTVSYRNIFIPFLSAFNA